MPKNKKDFNIEDKDIAYCVAQLQVIHEIEGQLRRYKNILQSKEGVKAEYSRQSHSQNYSTQIDLL